MSSISEWLESVKEGYGSRFVSAFEEVGVEDAEDLSELAEEEAAEALFAALAKSGAKAVQLQKIRRALTNLNKGPSNDSVDAHGAPAQAAKAVLPAVAAYPPVSGLRAPPPPPELGVSQDLDLLSQLLSGPRLSLTPPVIPRVGTVAPPSPHGFTVMRSGGGPLLYFVPNIDGEIFQPGASFQFVTHLLGNAHCVALEYNSDARECSSVRAVASLFARRILQDAQRRPGQTIYVVGYSFGCILAHEVSVQCQQVGRKVGLLLLGSEVQWPTIHNTLRPGGYPWLGGSIEAALQIARKFGGWIAAEEEVLALLDLPPEKRDANRVHMRMYWKFAGAADMPYEDFMYSVTTGADVMDALHKIFIDHDQPDVFSGEALMLLAQESQEFERASAVNTQFCTSLETKVVPGSHYTMLDHHQAPAVAKMILEWLREMGEKVSLVPTPVFSSRVTLQGPSQTQGRSSSSQHQQQQQQQQQRQQLQMQEQQVAIPTRREISDKVLKILNDQVMDPLEFESDMMDGGLDSISMSLVATQLQHEFGVQVTPGKIMELPKVNDLVDFLNEAVTEAAGPPPPAQQPKPVPVVAPVAAPSPAKPALSAQVDVAGLATLHKGDGPRAYLVHGIDADIFAPGASYSAVAPMLAPCHSLAFLYDDKAYACRDMKTLSAEYNRRLLEDSKRHPGKALFVVGYSFGCVIAHQMALQLQEQRIDCSLILVDFEVSYPPRPSLGRLGGYEWLGGDIEATLLMARSMGGVDGIKWGEGETELLLKQPKEQRDVRGLQDRTYQKIVAARKGFPRDQFQTFCDKGGRNMEQMNNIANPWQPSGTFRGQALLVLAPDSKDFHCAEEINRQYCSNIEVMYALGTHYSILQASLAPKAAACILAFMRRLGHDMPEAPSLPDIPGLLNLHVGDGPRLYMIHGIDGDIFSAGASYASVAPLLAPCNCAALVYDDEASKCKTLPELAALYNGRLFEDCMRFMGRPICIVGYSFGCVIAHQMALQIQHAIPDAEVTLILYDFEVSFPPLPSGGRLGGYDWLGGPIEAALLLVRSMCGAEGIWWGEQETQALLQKPRDQRESSQTIEEIKQRCYDKCAASRKGFRWQEFDIFCQRGGRSMDHMHSLADPFEPQAPFPGKTLLLLAEDSQDFHSAKDVNAKFCTSMETIFSPGTHYSILQGANAAAAARQTLAYLSRQGHDIPLANSDPSLNCLDADAMAE